VIPVHDFGDIGGVLYIDMRLVEGANLKDVLQSGGPLEPKRAASIVAQVAAALDAAHADGLVHRDIKPENVLLTADDFAYLADFGIAHAGGDASVTMTGSIVGSSAYMAAERFDGGRVGPAADVYSLTCVLHECLTGRPPFEAADLVHLMSAHMLSPPPRPSIMRRGISRAFDDVIARGMAKEPAGRFPSAGELARAATAAADVVERPQEPIVVAERPERPERPSTTRQFSTVYPNPHATGHVPYPPNPQPVPPPPPIRAPEPPSRRRRFGTGPVVLVAATILIFGVAAVLAAVLVIGNNRSGAPPRTSLAAPPPTSTSTTTSAAASGPAADAQGFVGHAARCESGDSPAVMIRTASSLAVVCRTGQGAFYYHGERLSDGANLRLANAVPSADGFDATNPADGARYEVRPDRLTIISNGHVDSSEPALPIASG
jgi:serine/threonine-protein kinase